MRRRGVRPAGRAPRPRPRAEAAGAVHRAVHARLGRRRPTRFGKRLTEEPAPRGVRVNTVSPGVTASRMRTGPDGFGGKVAAAFGVGTATGLPGRFGIASGRLTEPEEVADLAAFLPSDRAADIHAADHVIDAAPSKTA